ncbi:MAG: MBL fold metallo-hydrolase [Anaerolineae bacterium]|jgi:L-ascorbate metabolism protein UlaG (beta-lactamase superfamily)|nr:MBL fold metallo-hydrolase [Anaerolineae bacterium]
MMSTQTPYETDAIATSSGALSITFLGHGSLLFTFLGKEIYIDPFSRVADYTQMPAADVILLTHEHADHLDLAAIAAIRTPATQIVLTETCAAQIPEGIVMHNGDILTIGDLYIEAVPAYNIQHKRDNGQPFHPQGRGNGYILTFGDQRVYIAGDTENIPEMRRLQDIAIAFLPMNLPYTMTPAMAADAAKTFKPRVLYPYHYGNTNVTELVELLSAEKDIEVRIRKLA